MRVTDEQLKKFNQNFKICLTQTKTNVHELHELQYGFDIDVYGSSEKDYRNYELELYHIDEEPMTFSDVDKEFFTIEGKKTQYVKKVETTHDVLNFIIHEMDSILNEPLRKHLNSKTLNISSKQDYRKITDI